jgi:hypothetical protein
MKKIIFLTFLLSSISIYSQWTYKSGKSDFDGSYKTSSVYGSGGEFPYNKPLLVVNRFKESLLNIYISNAGYSGCSNNVISLKFNGDEKIYKTYYSSSGSNNDSWFLSSFYELEDFELLEKMMKHSSMSARLKSSCGYSDYKFSLGGSTKAINFVVGKNWIQQKKEEALTAEVFERKLLEKERKNKLELKEKREKRERGKEEKEILFLKTQQSQITLPFENIDEQKKEVEKLVTKSSLKFFKKEFYLNTADIKVYKNIYEVNEEFIIPRKTLIWIDEKYYHKKYYKIKYANKYYKGRRLYIKKKYLKKLFTD